MTNQPKVGITPTDRSTGDAGERGGGAFFRADLFVRFFGGSLLDRDLVGAGGGRNEKQLTARRNRTQREMPNAPINHASGAAINVRPVAHATSAGITTHTPFGSKYTSTRSEMGLCPTCSRPVTTSMSKIS